MYTITRKDKDKHLSTTKRLAYQITSLGLGIAVLQYIFGLYRIFHENGNSRQENFDSTIRKQNGHEDVNCVQSVGANENDPDGIYPKELTSSNRVQQECLATVLAEVFAFSQLYVCLVEVYLFVVLRHAFKKENISNCWLGLYLQILLLTYNTTEILIVACSGVFDGSSILLAARATVRAISIEMICSFLREIEDEEKSADVFLYVILTV